MNGFHPMRLIVSKLFPLFAEITGEMSGRKFLHRLEKYQGPKK
jgi:hypothetical protein